MPKKKRHSKRTSVSRIDANLFWLLEIVLVTPPLLFGISVLQWYLNGSHELMRFLVGTPPDDKLRSILFVLFFPIGSLSLALYYLLGTRGEKGVSAMAVRGIIVCSFLFLATILFYLFAENFSTNPLTQ